MSADLWRKYVRQGRRLVNFALVNFFKLTLAMQLLKEKGSLPLVVKGRVSPPLSGEGRWQCAARAGKAPKQNLPPGKFQVPLG